MTTTDDCNAPCTDPMRRCDSSRLTEAERLIHEAMAAVERLPADVRLTDAVTLLAAAKTRVADFVDGAEGHRTMPIQQLRPARPTDPAMSAALELEIQSALGRVTTRAIAEQIDIAMAARVIAADFGAIGEALGLFASCIKSGEIWTGTCQAALDKANASLARVRTGQPHSSEPASA